METDQPGRLRDILEAARLIGSHGKNQPQAHFHGKKEKQNPVIRRFEIIVVAAPDLSAGPSTRAGTVRRICFAAFKLITNSNFVACCTGKSSGLAPFNILSTYTAARGKRSVLSAP